MMYRTVAAALVFAASCAMAAAASGALLSPERQGPIRQMFDLYAGGLWVGEMRLDAALRDDRYVAGARIQTAGVVRAFFDAELSAEAVGAISDGLLETQRFKFSKVDGETETVRMAYLNGAPSSMEITPEWQPRDYSIDPLAQGPVADPLSGAISALAPRAEGFCDRRVEMFDGRKRFAVTFEPARQDGERMRCEGVWERVAGYKAKMMTPERRAMPFTVWFERQSDGLWSLEKAAMPTDYVTLTLVRRD